MASSRRARASEEGLGEVDGGGSEPNVLSGEVSGEDVGEVFSGELGGFGKSSVSLSKKVGWVNRPSKG